MSLFDWNKASRWFKDDEPFNALIMGAALRADSTNLERLRMVFPEIIEETERRYNAPGGELPGDRASVEQTSIDLTFKAVNLNKGKCEYCGHERESNSHGPDQNDYDLIEGSYKHSGQCTYCKVCNPER